MGTKNHFSFAFYHSPDYWTRVACYLKKHVTVFSFAYFFSIENLRRPNPSFFFFDLSLPVICSWKQRNSFSFFFFSPSKRKRNFRFSKHSTFTARFQYLIKQKICILSRPISRLLHFQIITRVQHVIRRQNLWCVGTKLQVKRLRVPSGPSGADYLISPWVFDDLLLCLGFTLYNMRFCGSSYSRVS